MADAAAESRAEAGGPTSDSADDFEFCILSSGGLVPVAKAAETDMCVADELFCQGKLLPLRPSAAAADGASVVTLPRSESAASTVGLVSRSGSRSASSSGSSSGCVSRSQSSKSASSEHGGAPAPPPRRSLSSSLFYAHPSPSPQLRSARPRRSTGSAPPPAAWGLFRLGVVGAPDVYPPPRPAEAKIAANAARGGGSRSARFEQVTAAVDKKLGLVGLLGDSLGCKCSPDAVEPARLPEAAKRSRKKDGAKSGQGVRRSRILDWLEELSIIKEKK
ncbi:zinc finger CCCH domain-containing protein 18 [Panicum miliaceum]|uniref:Zinc finger CCCH domain-containing protein 18 n=1 Tax=Panicum miliaceum TaxID=4540 RepID=A0A3L6T8G5_PANMI|nr:zinc finger CCCH domain-containing protein 18 [Panicum miliaceum]